MLLWIDLEIAFEELYQKAKKGERLDDDSVARFYKYAKWCLTTASTGHGPTDVSSAVCCAFFEHIILIERIREDMHRWIGPSILDQLSGAFTYLYPASEFAVFKEKFLQRYKEVTS